MSTTHFHPARVMLSFSLLLLAGLSEASGQGASVVISQVYGGGGNTGAVYKNDFIELLNRTPSPVDLTGWSVQYGSASGTTWQMTPLGGIIMPYRYFLVQEAAGILGSVSLPTPDATGTIAMAATSGKVALVNSVTALSGACPAPGIVDLVGYGSANCFETGTAPTLSNLTAAIRAGSGMTDTENNAADFIAGSPMPRNSNANPAVGVLPNDGADATPRTLSLFQNFPNPFNPSTTIAFTLPRASFVSLKVYDLMGREVGSLLGEELPPGRHRATFDASGLPSGAYICRLQAAGSSATGRLLLVR